jgi:hypothetical protein
MPEMVASASSARNDVRRTAVLVVASLLVALSGTMIAVVDHAAAAACTATVKISDPNGSQLTLSPSSVSVVLGGCVTYSNSTTGTVTLTVTETGTTTKTAKVTEGSTATVKPAAAGKASVTANGGLLNLVKGSGSITVKPQAKSGPSSSASPQPSGKHSSTPTTKPDVAPHPKHNHKKSKAGKGKHTPRPHATGIKLPPLPPLPTAGIAALPKASNPVVAPGPVSAPAVTDTSTPVAAIVSGPIEPGSSNGRGLPEAIAVLVVLGLVSGWGRVLLASPAPVDGDSKGVHRL